MTTSIEEQILQLAVARKLLSADQITLLDEELRNEELTHPASGPWGPRITLLMERGILDEVTLEALRRDLHPGEPAPGSRRTSAAPAAGSRFGHYQILGTIGQGGMARVYKAFDEKLGRVVALKLLRIEDPELIQRLFAEARAQARVRHEHVCEVYEVGEVEGRQYIAIQYIEGKNLKDAMAEMTLTQKVQLLQQVAEAMHAAHRVGIIHRDLKPANIMLEHTEDGRWIPYVMDFGLAREVAAPGLTVSGNVLGTPWYVSPEQARGEVRSLDPRTDIYSMGATLYELLTGKPPFDATSTLDILTKVLQEDPAPLRQRDPSIPADLETIAMRCLEKEPDQRYESARALAEDLARFLEGEPILASRTTWTHRTVRKLRKYPRFAWWMGVAVFLILALSALGLRNWWFAERRLRLANEFGQEARYVQETLRFAYTEPLHDVRHEEALVKERIQQIRTKMSEAGQASYGPGYYTIGRGEMALHHYGQAQTALMKAWDSYDYKLPEVAYSLGLTLAMLYQKELETATQIRSDELRTARVKEVEKEYRDEAVRYLHVGQQASADSAEYAEAILAFLAKDYDRALQKNDAAARRFPWFYEAHKLSGDIHVVRANEHRDKGQLDDALADYRKAEAAYGEAVARGQSDSETYEGLCGLQGEVMTLQMYETGVSPQGAFEAGLKACGEALQAHPDSPGAHERLALLYFKWSQFQIGRGEDPNSTLDKSIHEAQQTLRLNSQSVPACMVMASSYGTRAQYEMGHGRDPLPALKLAIASTEQASRINPNDPSPYNGRGICYFFMSVYERKHGIDPRASLDLSVRNCEKAVGLNPQFANGYSNMGLAQWNKANYTMEQGADPRPDLDRAARSFQRAIAINPRDSINHGNLGLVYSTRGDYEMASGLDPGSSLDRAIETYLRSLAINPEYSQFHNNLCVAYERRAQWAMITGKDPASDQELAIQSCRASIKENPQNIGAHLSLCDVYRDRVLAALKTKVDARGWLSQGQEFLDGASRVNASDPEIPLARGPLQIAAARLALRDGRSPVQELVAAEKSFQDLLKVNPESIDGLLGLAEADRWKAEWKTGRGEPAKEELEQGLDAATRVLAVHAQHPRAFALRGALQLLGARGAEDPAIRMAQAAEAEKSLQEALRLNANLHSDLDPLLVEARRLSHE